MAGTMSEALRRMDEGHRIDLERVRRETAKAVIDWFEENSPYPLEGAGKEARDTFGVQS